ncbi:MAG: hydantoinase/carbamoylase family amidase [Bacteroidetes bacterium]|nr:hydantoinase/carbamoylase family amidase [Bacteroidota bacterium]
MRRLDINSHRLHQRLEELSHIGRVPDGGINRLAFSEADKAGRDYVEACMRDLGMEVVIDPIGNLFGVVPGRRINGAVMAGSHTDTVGSGGRFDGALGVLAALEVAETLIESGFHPERPFIVCSFVNEEGVRFMPDMMGSLFHRGDLSIEDVRATTGTDGRSIGDELDRLDMTGTGDISVYAPNIFIELHIEQGPILFESNLSVAAVSAVQGLSWTEISISGAANHAGTTPMDRRKDAVRSAGELISSLYRDIADIPQQRVTAGSITTSPGLINVIAAECLFTVDMRNPDADLLREAELRLDRLVEKEQREGPCEIHAKRLARVEPTEFSARITDLIREAAEARDLPATTMISGAGHDAQILASKYESAMIFVPSVNGISHDRQEYTEPEATQAGANILLDTVLTLLEDKDISV